MFHKCVCVQRPAKTQHKKPNAAAQRQKLKAKDKSRTSKDQRQKTSAKHQNVEIRTWLAQCQKHNAKSSTPKAKRN